MTAEAATDELAAYRARVSGWDELTAPTGLRADHGVLGEAIGSLGLEGLTAARRELAGLVRDEGILYGESGRNWTVDPLPLIIGAAEWERLEAGLGQRARLLSLILADIYGEQRLLSSGAIAPEIVWGHAGFLQQACGVRQDDWLPLVATDLGRDASGRWTVLSDRTATPAGAGYAMANRRLTSRVMGELHHDARPARLRSYFAAMRAAMQRLAPRADHTPRGVLLRAGATDPTAYEQGFIATLLGYSLVDAEDLVLRDGQVWINSPDGRELVDVILRRVASELADPLEFRSDSEAGLAGLLEASRLRNVVCVNPLGSGVLENPALLAHLPTMARQLLGEDLILQSATTWWCGAETGLSHALANLGRLLIKPIARAGERSTIPGWELTAVDRAELAARITAQPWAWCVQEPVGLSTTPVVTDHGLVPRRLVLRTFGVRVDAGHEFLPGGLARVATGDRFAIGDAQRPLSKDVWVLDPEDSTEAWQAGPDGGALTLARPTTVAPRVADNLVWLGRYSERAESSVRLLRRCLDLASDYGRRPGTRGAQVLAAVALAGERITGLTLGSAEPATAQAAIRSAVADPGLTGSVAHSIRLLTAAAHEVPDIMSDDVWHVLSRFEDLVDEASHRRDLAGVLDALVVGCLAMAGINAESLTRDATWAYVDIGVRIERAQRTLGLVEKTFGQERAAIVEAQLADAVAEIGESLITQRRRVASGATARLPAMAVTHLLVLDRTNPRSVAFQLERLADDLRIIGDQPLSVRVSDLGAGVGGLDLPVLFDEGRPSLAAELGRLRRGLRDIADELGRTHLTRAGRRRAVVTGWTGNES